MNEQNEIRGDEIEDVQEDLERIDAAEHAPEPHPPTSAELEDMFREQDERAEIGRFLDPFGN